MGHFKIGVLKNQIVTDLGKERVTNYTISENLDTSTYNDISSIENWAYIAIDLIDDINIIRSEISDIIDSKGGWNNLTLEEKNISSKFFCVDKTLRDEIYNDDEQKKNIDFLLKTQRDLRKLSFINEYDKSKEDIDNYLENLKLSNDVRNYNLSKIENGATNMNSDTFIVMDKMEFINVPVGKYFLNFSCNISAGGGTNVYTRIYINGVYYDSSEQEWFRAKLKGGNASTMSTHTYLNYPITVNTNSTIEIQWRVEGGTAVARNRAFSLIKI